MLRLKGEELYRAYRDYCAVAWELDMTRGKPSREQLDMVTDLGLGQELGAADYRDALGQDLRNYGQLTGIAPLKKIFAQLLCCQPAEVICLNNSSLSILYDFLQRALLFPLPGATVPWRELRPKALCPVPGYDRHFQMAEYLGFELIPIPQDGEGPVLEQLSTWAQDPSVKVLFTVPRYGNPSGVTMTAKRLAAILDLPWAPDFRLIWDNAYAVHSLYWPEGAGLHQDLPNLSVLDQARLRFREDAIVALASTSKMTYAGSGVAAVALSTANRDWLLEGLSRRSIGPNTCWQLSQARFLERVGIEPLMRRHADLLRPKFALVLEALEEAFGNEADIHWSHPAGGYFISLYLPPGRASLVWRLAARAGLRLTPAGAAFPYGSDPEDSHLRLAPSYLSLEELRPATEILILSISLALEGELPADLTTDLREARLSNP